MFDGGEVSTTRGVCKLAYEIQKYSAVISWVEK